MDLFATCAYSCRICLLVCFIAYLYLSFRPFILFSARFVFYTTPLEVKSNLIQRKKAVNYLNKFQLFLFNRSKYRVAVRVCKKVVRNYPINTLTSTASYISHLQHFSLSIWYFFFILLKPFRISLGPSLFKDAVASFLIWNSRCCTPRKIGIKFVVFSKIPF